MVRDLPELCLSPVADIPQVGRRPRLIFDFVQSGLNEAPAREAPEEEMWFVETLHHIIRRILQANPQLGPVYLGKLHLSDAYMRLWVSLDDTPSVAFLLPKKNPNDKQLVGFHLALPMGYVDSAPFFCISTEMIEDVANEAIRDHHYAPPHPLDILITTQAPDEQGPEPHDNRQWTQSPIDLWGHALAQVDVYLDNSISTCQ